MHISKYAHSTRVRIHHLFYAIDDNTMDTKLTTRVVHSMMTLILEKYELVIINMTTRILYERIRLVNIIIILCIL